VATINIANLTFSHKGNYDGSTAYVKNDVVYYATNGNAYIAKQNTTGNVPTNGTYWSQFAAGSGGIWNAGLSLGSAEQIVQVNSAGNALEFTAKPEGKVKAVHFLSNNTRTSLSSAVNLTWLTVGSFTKTDASTILYVQGVVPEVNTAADALGCWLQIGTNADPGDNQDVHKGILRVPTNTGQHTGGTTYNMKFTGIGAGSQTLYVGQNNRDNNSDSPAVINPNNSDESRLQQTASQFTIWEVGT
jgi:hypothetical protein